MVVTFAGRLRDHEAAKQEHFELFRFRGEELFGRAPALFGDGAGVHAEAGGEHFRQQDERPGFRLCHGEQCLDPVEVLPLVLPRDVMLDAIEFHKFVLGCQ